MLKSTRLALIVALLLFALAHGAKRPEHIRLKDERGDGQTITANGIDRLQRIKRDVGSMSVKAVDMVDSEKPVHDKKHGEHHPVTHEEFRHFVGNYSFFEAFPERSMNLCRVHFHRCSDHLQKDDGVSATVVANWQLHVQERCAPDFDHCRRASDHFRYSHPFPADRCLRSPYPTAECRNKGFCDVRNRQCAGEWTHHNIGDKKEAGKECSDLFRCVNRKDVREDSLAVCVNHIKDHGDNGEDLGADENADGAADMAADNNNFKNDAHRSAEVKNNSEVTSEATPWMKDSSCDASDQCEWVLHPDGSTREAPLLPIPNCHIHPHTSSPDTGGSGSQATGEDGDGAHSKHKTFFQKFKILLIVIAGATVLAGGLIMLKLSRPAPGQPRFEFEDEPWTLPSAPQRDPVRWYGLLTPEDLVDKERKVSAKRSSSRVKKAPPMITPSAVPVRTATDVREYPQQGSPTSGLYDPPLAQGAHTKGKTERASVAATTSSAIDGGGGAFGATVMESCGETSSSGELLHEQQHHAANDDEAKAATATSPSSGKPRRLRRAASVTFEGSPTKNHGLDDTAGTTAAPPTFKLDTHERAMDTERCERGEGRVCIRASCDTDPSEIRATAPRYLLLPCRCEWCGCHEPAGQERKNPQQNKHRNRLIAALAGRFAATPATSMQHAPSEQSLADLEAGLLPRHEQGFHLNNTGSESVAQHGESGNDVRDRPVLESVVGINTVEYGLRVGAPTVPHSTDPSKATYGCVRCGEAIDHIVDIHGLFAEPETGPGLDLSVKEEEKRQLEEQQRKRASLRRRRRTYDDDDDERSASAVSVMSSSNSRSVSANRTARVSSKNVNCRPPSMTIVGVGPKKVQEEGQDALSANECRSPRRCPSAALDAPFASPPRPRRAASGLSSDRRSTPAARGREVTSPVHKSTLPPRPASSLARLSGASAENCAGLPPPAAAPVNVDQQHTQVVQQQRGRTARGGSNGGTPVSVVVRSGSFSSSRGHQTSNRSTPSDPALTKSETSAPAFPALGSQEACDDVAAVAADRSSSAFSRGASSRHNSGLQTPPQCDVYPPASSGAQPRQQQPSSKDTNALHGAHGAVVGVPMHRSGRSDRSGAGSAASAHSHMSGQSGKSYASRRTSFCALATSASDSRSYGSAANGADGEAVINEQSQGNNGPLVHGGAAPDCVVCFSAPVSSAFLPCGHLATCDECAGRICDATQQQRQHVVRGDGDDNARLETGTLCPLCRAIVAAVVVLDERQASGAAQAAHVADEQRCHAGRHPL